MRFARLRISSVWTLVLVSLLFLAPRAWAQSQLQLSRHADFSTNDRLFSTDDTLYLHVAAADLDATAMEESSFEIDPDGEGQDVEGHFTNHLDGSFTASVPLRRLEVRTASWQVQVELEDDGDRSFEARAHIVVRGLVDQPEPVTVRGTVEAATATSFTLGGQTFAVDEATVFRSPIELGDDPAGLVGQPVTVRAAKSEDAVLLARLVVVQTDEAEQQGSITVRGSLSLAGPDAFRVRDRVFHVDEATIIEGEDGEVLALQDLQAGLVVLVDAQRVDDAWLATSVTVLTEEAEDDDEDEREEEIAGPIEEIGPEYIVVAAQRLEVDAETEFDGFETLGELVVGTFVEVEFVTRDDALQWALEIEVDDEDDDEEHDREDEVEVAGVITAVSADTLTVNGIAFVLREETEVEGARGADLTVADLYTGLEVEVKGERAEDGAVVAREVRIESEMETELDVSGVIASVDADTLRVGEVAFVVDAETEIEGEHDAVLTPADLVPGLYVEAELKAQASGSYVATKVEVEDHYEAEDVEVKGAIEALSATSITVNSLTFAIGSDTEIAGEDDAVLTWADLAQGQVVEVEGAYLADSSLVASRIKVEERLHREGELRGPITAIQEDTITVAGVAFRTAKRTHVRGPQHLAELSVGDAVELDFRLFGDGSHLALRLKLEDEDGGAHLKGIVDSVGTGIMHVAGIAVETTGETTAADADGEMIAVADVAAGSMVVVRAEWTGDALVASSIDVRRAAVVSGAVEARTDGSFRVAGQDVALTTETRVYGRNNTELSLEDVQAGAFIEVLAVSSAPALGKTSAATVLTAESVQVLAASVSTGAEEPAQAKRVTLAGNYPNPFRTATTIEYDLARAGSITLTVYDVLGRQVHTLVQGRQEAGLHRIVWDGRGSDGRHVAAGVYLYELDAGGQTQTRRMLLVK